MNVLAAQGRRAGATDGQGAAAKRIALPCRGFATSAGRQRRPGS